MFGFLTTLFVVGLLAMFLVFGVVSLVFSLIGFAFRLVFGVIGFALGIVGAVFGTLLVGGIALLALPVLALPLVVLGLLVWFVVRLVRAPSPVPARPALPGVSAPV